MSTINIVFAVCHPDDEALWVGGLLHGLSQFPGVSVHVICLSGQDKNSPRPQEFSAAKAIAGYKGGVVVGNSLRPARQPLPPIDVTLGEGLKSLNLKITDINILFTHSPFGEEHMHPHHVQASIELYNWAKKYRIPFGYFSCLPLPNSHLQPVLKNMKQFGSLQLLNYAWCSYGVLQRIVRWREKKYWRYPRLYLQWLVDPENKRAMLECYRSIDLEMHKNTYAMFSNNVESLYLFDKKAINIFDQLLDLMATPGSQDYFPGTWTNMGLIKRITNKFFKRLS